MMKLTKQVCITSDVRLDELIEQMSEQLSHDNIFDFIVNLDKALVDWEFTERLFVHFESEMKKLSEEDRA